MHVTDFDAWFEPQSVVGDTGPLQGHIWNPMVGILLSKVPEDELSNSLVCIERNASIYCTIVVRMSALQRLIDSPMLLNDDRTEATHAGRSVRHMVLQWQDTHRLLAIFMETSCMVTDAELSEPGAF